ncbi:TetR/AcrR family transcriptional regulator [Tenacibaculum sp. 190524A05c]|uniref:TetR/AcrR family transcriptional regulator n=1 Tax=Tenacibaculum platacis TaxID=3137852 RepID=A0ABM9P1Y6_9FLAO
MTTKQKILTTSLQLFNTIGYANISSKTISETIGISYGNLCYHFPKKDDIVMRLHQNFLDEMDESMLNLKGEIFEFDFMLRSLENLMNLTYKYRFLLLNGYDITLKHLPIKQRTMERSKVYSNIIYKISKFLIENGYMHDNLSDKQLKLKLHGLLIIFNSWVADKAVFSELAFEENKDHTKYYIQLLFSMISSALTKKGIKAFSTAYDRILNKNIQD